jgi:hypothetical protein
MKINIHFRSFLAQVFLGWQMFHGEVSEHSHRKTEKTFFLTTRDVRYMHHWWHGTHRYDIQVLATYTRQHGCIDILHCCNDPCRVQMVLSVGGSFAYFAQNARCTVTTDLLVWYSNTQNDFSPGAAIFLLHTHASPSGRNVNYDEKKTYWENIFELLV